MRTLIRYSTSGLALLTVVLCAATCLALTIDVDVTPEYLKEHPKEFSIEATRRDDGLIHFTIVHSVSAPKYHVAHLAVYHQGKLISKSDTPAYGRKGDNTFYVALAPENLVDSKFELSDSELSGTSENAVARPGTINHRFHLAEFVPPELLKATK